MNAALSEITLDKLHAFARRRRFLIAMRGLCVGIVALLVAMSAIAAVDYFFIIKSQPLRWSLTLTGYAIVALVIWLTCLRALLRIPGPGELARLVEKAAPGLREDLISAVELGSPQSDSRYDSPLFRALLQSSVEERMSRVHIAALLPGGLIRGIALLTTFVLSICVALLLIPDLHFAQRLTRALLPSAPVDRVANVRVTIVAPNPADALVPHNDAVNVIIELAGDEVDSATIETFRTEEGREEERIALKPAGGTRRFSGMIQLGSEPVQYRVLAGDAVTRLYTIDTGPRPHAVAFAKTYRFPDYAEIEAKTETEKHGHLAAIEGTKAEIVIDVDQPVKAGELRFDDPAGLPPIALRRISDTQWGVSVPITLTTTYKVHLTAAATGFDNAFDPPYEITMTPDQPPVLTVESPGKDLLIPQGEAVDVKLSASDDLGLGAISQSYRINGGAWVDVKLAGKAGRALSVSRKWDLYDLNLRPGDQFATRFSASDGAGHKTESTPVTITIAAAGFDPDRLAGLEGKRRVLAAIASLKVSTERASGAFNIRLDTHRNAGVLERKQTLLNAAQAAQKLRDDADDALAVVRGAIRPNNAGSSADDMVQAGLIVSQLRDEIAGASRASIELAAAMDDAVEEADALATGHTAMIEMARSLEVARGALMTIVASDIADATLRDLLSLRAEQRSLAPASQPDDPATWQRLARRQMLLAAQAGQVQAMVEAAEPELMNEVLRQRLAQGIGGARARVQDVLAKAPTKASVITADAAMSEAIDAALIAATQAARMTAMPARTIDAVSSRLHRALDPIGTFESDVREQRPMAGRPHWASAMARLATAAKLHEARADADAAFVADIGLLRRAVKAIESRIGSESDTEVRNRASRVAFAFRTLEMGHAVAELHAAALAQANLEKWMRSEPDAVTRHARQWDWMKRRIPMAAQDLSVRDRGPETALTAAGKTLAAIQSGGPATILDVEMASRRLKAQVAKKRPEQFEQIAQRLAEVKALIADDMAKARAIIAAEAPTIAQQMASLAVEAKKIEKQAADAAATIDADKGDAAATVATKEETQSLRDAQAKLDAKLDELAEALRHDANKQDAFTKEGRERARDADDAAAMVREPAEKAKEALDAAADAGRADEQKEKLGEAAQQDAKLAERLEQLAEHYKNLAAGKGEETRSALREAERELGIKREKDAEFGRMERLAELAGKSPQEQMAELEKELKQNPAMQAELSDIARAAADEAKSALEDAAAQERGVEQELAAAQKAAEQDRPDVAGQTKEIAKQAAALGGKTPAIAEQAKKATASDAAQSAREAGQSLEQASKVAPPVDAKDHEAAAKQAGALAKALNEATEKLKEAEKQATAAAKRVRDEEAAATAKLAVGDLSEEERLKAADTMLHAKNREAMAKQAAAAAREAAAKAEKLAAEAGRIAEQSFALTNARRKALDEGLRKQPAIAEAVKQAGEDVARAQRHEERMESAAAAKSLADAKSGIEGEASKQVGKSADALAKATQPREAQPAVKGAESAIAQQAAKLEQMLKQDGATGRRDPAANAAGERGDDRAARDEQTAKWMARALDELDRAANDGKGAEVAMGPEAMNKLAQGAKPGVNAPGKNGEGEPGAGDGKQPGQNGKDPGQSGKQPGDSSGSANAKQPAGESASQAAQAAAAQAVREAAQAQASAMAQARQSAGAPAEAESGPAGEAMASNQKPGEPSGSSKGGPGQSPGGEGSKASSDAMASSAKGKPGKSEGQGGSGAGSQADSRATGDLPDADALRRGEWGKLPARLARELMEGQRDEVPSEYRSQVEAYFRAIAQKAKQK